MRQSIQESAQHQRYQALDIADLKERLGRMEALLIGRGDGALNGAVREPVLPVVNSPSSPVALSSMGLAALPPVEIPGALLAYTPDDLRGLLAPLSSEMRLSATDTELLSDVERCFCPITQCLMSDPVKVSDGHSYERAAMEQWLLTHNTSPLTNLALTDGSLRADNETHRKVERIVALVVPLLPSTVPAADAVPANPSEASSALSLGRAPLALRSTGTAAVGSRRLNQRRAQLIHYVESVGESQIRRDDLAELLDEFPDALRMIREMEERRRAYEESGRSEGTDERAALEGKESLGEGERQIENEHLLQGFVRKHWKKILCILSLGGVDLLCWFWGPSVWSAFKSLVTCTGSEALLSEVVSTVGPVAHELLRRNL